MTFLDGRVREKVRRHVSGRLVEYDLGRWELMAALRARAARVQGALGVPSLVYGSVARGDVTASSDVDVVILEPFPSYAVELSLSEAFHVVERRLTIASPNSVPKASLTLDDGSQVSWPLLPPKPREAGFYSFGGAIDATRAGPRDRVPGVSKRLLLIEPVETGHVETSVLGAEVEAARTLGLPMDVVEERVRVLARRDQVGRTGVFRSLTVGEGNTFEQLLDSLADTTPAVRRQMRYRGSRR